MLITALLVIYLLAPFTLGAPPIIESTFVLWKEGDHGVPSYRIPILSHTPKGNLIALAEGRRGSSSDIGQKYIVMRRSTDGGKTWGPNTIILTDDTRDGMNLGSVVVDDENKVIHIISIRCAHYYYCSTAETYQMTSHDDGLTWTEPKLLNRDLGTKMFIPGPGTGLQKKQAPNKGRLVVCGYSMGSGNGMFIIVSDNYGTTWRYAGGIKSIPYLQNNKWGDFTVGECQPFELPDGSIVVNIRNEYQFHCPCRTIARSYDGGETFQFEDMYFDDKLIDPAVAAGANIHRGILYFSNPHETNQRQNLQLTWSYDQGRTWATDRLLVWKQKAAYSVIEVSPFDNNYIFLALERGVKSAYEEIAFHRINVQRVRDQFNTTLLD